MHTAAHEPRSRPSGDPVGGRFALGRHLKHGNGVAAYAGVDSMDGSPVIVKTVVTSAV